MSDDIEYGKQMKRVIFTENDHRHAQLILKLKYLRITQAAFFRHIITGMLEEDPLLTEYVNNIAFKSKKKKTKAEKLQKSGLKKKQDFGLSEGDVDNLFDLIEQEFPNL